MDSTFIDKYHGCLIGLAVGDCTGGPLEFSERDTLCLFNELEANYHFNLPVGFWYDDTAEALCVANSIIENKQFDYADFLRKYHKFITDGYAMPNEKTFELTQYMKTTALKIGLLLKYRKKMAKVINPNDHHQIDCEPLIRIAPVVLTYFMEPKKCIEYVEELSLTTHVSSVCSSACMFYANLMIGALMGVSKENLLSEDFNVMDITTYGKLKYNKITTSYLENCTDTILVKNNQNKVTCKSTKENKFIREMSPWIVEIQKGSYKNKSRDDIQTDNHIIHCLEAALWAFYTTDNFKDGCLVAANLCGNSDTVAAIYGQLAGIYYGFAQIPQKWISKLHKFEDLYKTSQNLLETAAVNN
jgi:ADP-ribosyl-[dinitrogen reductase] hydrolase